jgi:hypothetical protein
MNGVYNSIKKFQETAHANWNSTLKDIFPVTISCTWRGMASIISILNKIGSMPSTHHTFMPDGGGLDLTGAAEAGESNAIALLFGNSIARIVKPSALYFESFCNNNQWAYFRLEIAGLLPSGVCKQYGEACEELTELEPGSYVERSVWERGFIGYDEDGQEIPLPEGARLVFRYFKGAFVIFAKTSPYNAISDTYDARHNNMTSAEFRQYIEKLIHETKVN